MKAKSITALLFLTAFSFNCFATHLTKVIGLGTLDNTNFVLLETKDSMVTTSGKEDFVTSRFLAREGEVFTDREVKDAHVQVEITQIDLANGSVNAKEDGIKKVYSFTPIKISGRPTFGFDRIDLKQALRIYGSINKHTMLIHPAINSSLPVSIWAQDKSELTKVFADFLRANNIAVIPDGDSFELVVPASLEKTASSFVQSHVTAVQDKQIPANYFNWENIDLGMASDIYGKLMKRTLIKKPLPAGHFSLNTSEPLSSADMVHIFDVLFAFNGVKAVNVGDDSYELDPDGSLKL